MKKHRWIPSPSMAVALIALFVGLSGAGYAAMTLPRNSVGTLQIRDGQVKNVDLAAGAVNSTKVVDRSLRARDFYLGVLPAGKTCPSGQSVTGFDSAGGLICSDPTPGGGPASSPSVSIQAPGDGETRNADEPVAFVGQATDGEDGNLTGGSIVWTDNLDGQIGTGTSFSATLSQGQHTVTATATDSDGNTASAAIALTVTT